MRGFSERPEKVICMQIIFYNNNSDVNVYPKSLSQVSAINGAFRAETIDQLQPVFEISSATPIAANYMYIPTFRRYYFCTIDIVRTGLYKVTGNVDVLQSWFDYIKECPCILSRSSNVWNAYISDDKRKFYQKTTRQYITIGDVGTPSELILVTVG